VVQKDSLKKIAKHCGTSNLKQIQPQRDRPELENDIEEY
jgi:hypothetical protein